MNLGLEKPLGHDQICNRKGYCHCNIFLGLPKECQRTHTQNSVAQQNSMQRFWNMYLYKNFFSNMHLWHFIFFFLYFPGKMMIWFLIHITMMVKCFLLIFKFWTGKEHWMRCRPFWQYLLKKSIIYKNMSSTMGAKNLQFAICSFYARKKLSWRRRKFLLRAISHSVISWTPLCTSYATKWVREPIWVQNLIQTQYRYVPLDCSLDLLKIVPKQLEFLVAVQGIALDHLFCNHFSRKV